MSKGLRVIITGASGMVGEGVLHECLQHPDIAAALVISRKPTGIQHPKLKEIIHQNFYDLSPVREQLAGYDACYFCLGISSVGISAEEYYKVTYTLTMHMAETLAGLNPEMTFIYVSGSSTDSSEKGRIRWARVKGKTENDLMKLPFKNVYAFRPGFMKPTKGLKNAKPFYKYILWMYPIGKLFSPGGFCTLREVGLAMINITLHGYPEKVIEGKDILVLARI